jgi:hypothetical protein
LQATFHSAVYHANDPSFQLLCLPLAAILAARNGNPRQAVELLGLTYTAPRNLIAWLDKWPMLVDLRANLETELDAEAFGAAWERGKSRDLKTVMAELLAS